MTPITLEEMARQAIDGDREALEGLVRLLQADIYGLSLRMLWNREDAEDATQEILVRIVTRLSQFDFRSRLKTWAYRVAVNLILDVKKSAIERLHLSFERFAGDLTDGLQLAYVLGELMDFPGPEGAEALGISPALFRKRLQFARQAILEFTRTHCGLVSDTAACRCNRRVAAAALANPEASQPLQFACRATSFQEARALVRQVDEARRAAEVHRTSRPRASSIDFAHRLMDAFDHSRELGPQS